MSGSPKCAFSVLELIGLLRNFYFASIEFDFDFTSAFLLSLSNSLIKVIVVKVSNNSDT